MLNMQIREVVGPVAHTYMSTYAEEPTETIEKSERGSVSSQYLRKLPDILCNISTLQAIYGRYGSRLRSAIQVGNVLANRI